MQIKPKDGIDGLYAPRRKVIDSLLVDAARSAGAEVLFETRLVDLSARATRLWRASARAPTANTSKLRRNS